MWLFMIKHLKILGSVSFTRWLVEAPKHDGEREYESTRAMF